MLMHNISTQHFDNKKPKRKTNSSKQIQERINYKIPIVLLVTNNEALENGMK